MPLELYYTLLLLPLFAALAAGLFGQRMGDKAAMAVTTGAVGVTALLSVWAFISIAVLGKPAFTDTLLTWLKLPEFTIGFGLFIDKLTVTMLLVVSWVSAMVHVYSIGYMSHDTGRARFFSYLSLFTFVMLVLVTSNNLLQLFLGWEGVGLASYLLIGFWHHKESANQAAIKAFIVNRVADVGLILALATSVVVFGTLQFSEIFAMLPGVVGQTYNFLGFTFPTLGLVAVFLLVGAMGKSAQFGFHTWLPDAMEGPTPVSALIHAATMVTAGVFLLARFSPLFEMSGGVLTLVAWVGGVTAVLAAIIGLTQTDIKRVIAYSTCSQLGYMFFACGVSAYTAAIFHLMTHAFFKALLFLGAGSVIHGLHDEQDMRKMGGVMKLLPVTYGLMLLGSLALAGVPPFAGFFSKDFILESALMSGGFTGVAMYSLGGVAALMTAFYSFRLMYMVFAGASRADKKTLKAVHEAPWVMLAPMGVLALGAVLAGMLGTAMTYTEWWHGAIVIDPNHVGTLMAHHTPALYKYLPLLLALVGIILAVVMYGVHKKLPAQLALRLKPLYLVSLNKFYVDEFYRRLWVRPTLWLGAWLWKRGDEQTINRYGPDGAARLVMHLGADMRPLQTGYIYHYAFVMIVAMCALITWFFVR